MAGLAQPGVTDFLATVLAVAARITIVCGCARGASGKVAIKVVRISILMFVVAECHEPRAAADSCAGEHIFRAVENHGVFEGDTWGVQASERRVAVG